MLISESVCQCVGVSVHLICRQVNAARGPLPLLDCFMIIMKCLNLARCEAVLL